MKITKASIGLLLAGLVLLPGCVHVPTYRAKSLRSVSDDIAYRGIEKNIIVQAKRLTKDDHQHLFGANGERMNNSLEVIYLSVFNMSNISYLLLPTDIDCAMLSHREVAQYIKTNSVTKLAGGVASVGAAYASIYLGLAGALLAGSSMALSVGISLAAVSVGLGLTAFGIGIKSMVMNHRINKDLAEKIVHKQVIIKSGAHHEGLIFVKWSDFKTNFAVTMREKDNTQNVIQFNVQL